MNENDLKIIMDALQLKYKPLADELDLTPRVIGQFRNPKTHICIYAAHAYGNNEIRFHLMNIEFEREQVDMWVEDFMCLNLENPLEEGQCLDDYIRKNFVPQILCYLG